MTSSLAFAMDALHEAIVRHLGLDIPPERWRHLRQRIAALAATFPSANLAEPSPQAVVWNDGEVARLAALLTVGETYFFREAAAFDALASTIFPELIASARERDCRLTVWSAGCSTGEEIYSAAVLLRRLLRDASQWRLTLLGTDVNPDALAAAVRARFGSRSFREQFHGTRPEWCLPCSDGRVELRPEIREFVAFCPSNLVAPAPWPLPAGSVDLLLCRNVLMYFRRDCVDQVVQRLVATLRPGGVLLLGASESHFAEHPELELRQIGSFHYFVRRPHREVRPSSVPAHTPGKTPAPVRDTGPGTNSARKPRSREKSSARETFLRLRNESAPSPHPERSATEECSAMPPGAVLRRARELADSGHLAQAREWAEAAVRLLPLQPASHLVLGSILQEQEELAQARQSFRNAAFLDPNSARAYFHLGMIALRQRRRREAIANLQRTLHLLQREADPPGWEAEGVSLREMRRMIQGAMEQIHEQG